MQARSKLFVIAISITAIGLGGLVWAGHHALELEAGDTVYACNCGDACKCKTLSMKEGACGCGAELVKATVKSVSDDGTAMLEAEGWEKPREFKTVGAYACSCGEKCTCKTISQAEGKCQCGADLKKVKS